MSRTYGYYIGQTYTLDNIKKKYPNLQNEIFLIKNDFDLKYLKSIKDIEQFFTKNMSKKQWSDLQKMVKDGIKKQLNTNISYEESLEAIQVVKARIKGDIESPVIETLLMFNPNYQKNPIEELNDKFIQTYNSKDNPKAKGVDFSVKVPKSWKSQEANRPNIVRKFTSNNGYIIEDTFIENIMILVYDLPIEVKKLTSQDVTDVCNDIPENSVLRDCKATTLENLPVVVQRLKLNMKRLENCMNMEVVQYNVFYKNKMIIIQGQVGTMNEKISEKTLLERFEKFKPVFNYVANSLMISNLYKQRRIK
ncbi:hypothetical protein [Aliarcobacter cryaerophilus]|uniref:hypothetical protein n=1 Tax=Aliarcobacter cryaerophilus TaxID=28198 RepID=UPI00112F72BC|nr:hypothetical protein [Aliarcobacter cryaerophilus]